MKIEASMVNMESCREYYNYVNKKEVSITSKQEDAAAIFEISSKNNGKSLVENVNKHIDNKEKEAKKAQEENIANLMSNMISNNRVYEQKPIDISSEKDLNLECLRKIIEGLNKILAERLGKTYKSKNCSFESTLKYAAKESYSVSMSGMKSMWGGASTGSGTSLDQSKWVKTTATSFFKTEVENTTFNSKGYVKTQDGREIAFGVSVEMSRAFCAKYDSLVQEEVIFTDPLVINMDGNVANISDQKFLFDLNCDGDKEEISFTGEGSGFLALDKNSDGKINDGSELFGTKSGNGFKDLAKYDIDGNGWIDENDDIFDDLRVWTKDSEGNDRLVGLLESDIGAIYLGYVDTEFTLNNIETNDVNGVVRSTGVFLKESGGTGTVQHVDLAL